MFRQRDDAGIAVRELTLISLPFLILGLALTVAIYLSAATHPESLVENVVSFTATWITVSVCLIGLLGAILFHVGFILEVFQDLSRRYYF